MDVKSLGASRFSLENKKDQIYLFLVCSFVVVLVLTNIVGAKLFMSPWGHALTAGIITYPLTFWFTDLVSEMWGAKQANMMVYLGFAMSLIMLVIIQVALALPAHDYWVPAPDSWIAPNQPPYGYTTAAEYQNAYRSVFSVNGVLLFGSMLAYMVAQLLDVKLYHFWKRLTKGKHLWLRNNGSTMISQLVDTAIVNSILFYIGFNWSFWQGVEVMGTIYLYKLVMAALDTPFIYLSVFVLKKVFKEEDLELECA